MGTPPPVPEAVRAIRLEERAPSITTLIVDAVKAVSAGSVVPVHASELLTAVQADVQGLQSARFAGFASEGHNGMQRPQASPFAAASGQPDGSAGLASPSAVGEDAESHLQHQSATTGNPGIRGSCGVQRQLAVTPQVEGAGDPASWHPQMPTSPRTWGPSSTSVWEQPHGDLGPQITHPSTLMLPLSAPGHMSTAPARRPDASDDAGSGPAPVPADDGYLLPLSTRQRLQHLLPEVMHAILPKVYPAMMPSAIAAALPAASTALAVAAPSLSTANDKATPAAIAASVLESALLPALEAVVPQALGATLMVLFRATKGVDASLNSPFSSCADAAASQGERQSSLDQQGAAELQLVRMLFGADGMDTPLVPPQLDAATMLHIPSVHTGGGSSPSGSMGAAGSGDVSRANSGRSSPTGQSTTRPSSATASAREDLITVESEHLRPLAAASSTAPRRPSLAALTVPAGGAEVSLSPVGGDMFSRRLSDTNYSTTSSITAQGRSSHPPVSKAESNIKALVQHASQGHVSVPAFRSSSIGSAGGAGGHTTPSWAPGEDVMSSADEALSTCSANDVPSPYTELCVGGGSGPGTGAAVNSSTNSFLLAAGSSVNASGGIDAATAAAAGLYGINCDALFDRLQQQVPQQQQGPPGMASPAEMLMAAASGGARTNLGSQLTSQGSQSQAATAAAAALFMQQQQQQHQQAAAAQQQLQQLQQLLSVRSVNGLADLADMAPTSPPLTSATGGLQWRRTSGTNNGFATNPVDLWQSADADALGLAATLALGQQQQQQQAVAAGLLQQQQQQQQLLAQSLAAVAAANAAGRPLRAEDLVAFGGAGAGVAGLQLPSAAAAAQLAAAAAAAAAPGAAAAGVTDLASYMDAALRRMLLVSPQVAAELARACGAFSGAHAQLHHLCCVIAEQLLDVAAMAPEVAAALLRALAAHRARGAQATDVDPRVMGRILQLLRAGPAGRQLCLVSLEQWVDGLSRIHKRRAYLDTILHNYQLTLKRLVQAMGHQVHAVNMSLPRQLLNDLSPRALLLLTAELAPYPLLQPRRWSEEIIWTVTQMHAMGIDMPANPATATATQPGGQAPLSAFQWEVRRALAATAEDITAAGGAAVACGQSPPGGAGGALAAAATGLSGLGLTAGATGAGQGTAGSSSGSTTPGGTAVPWAAHAALHRHLLMGLRRVQTRFFSERLRKVHGLYGESVEALLRSSLPQDVLVPEREVVVLVAVLLMLECRMRPEDFDAAFGRDLQRCLAVSPVEEVAARLRCGLVPDSPLRIDPHKSRALSQLLKLGTLTGQTAF